MLDGSETQANGDLGTKRHETISQEHAVGPVASDDNSVAEQATDAGQSEGEFSKLLREQESANSERELKGGQKGSGVLVKIGEENSFIDFGGRSEGVIKTAELREEDGSMQFSDGDPIEVLGLRRGTKPS